jgi:hypothetical protein
VALEAAVAARRDDDDAVLPRLLGRVGEWIHRVQLRAVGPVGEVQDPDVQTGVLGVLDDPIDGGDHLGDIGAAVCRADLDADDPGIGGDAPIGRGRSVRVGNGELRIVPGDESGHERPVAERVEVPEVRCLRLDREVRPVENLAGRCEALDRGNAGVDHRHIDAGARVAGVPPVDRPRVAGHGVHRVDVGRRIVRGVLGLHLGVLADGDDAGKAAKGREDVGGNSCRESADDRQALLDHAADVLDGALDRGGRTRLPHHDDLCARGRVPGGSRGARRADRDREPQDQCDGARSTPRSGSPLPSPAAPGLHVGILPRPPTGDHIHRSPDVLG